MRTAISPSCLSKEFCTAENVIKKPSDPRPAALKNFLQKTLKKSLTKREWSVKIYKLSHETRRAHLENYIVQSEKTKRDSFEEREEAAEAVQPERVLRRLR